MTFLRNLSVAILLLLTGVVGAQSFDPLEQARQTAKLNAQKLRAELTANFIDAAKFERSNPEKARELLRRNRLLLEDDNITLPQQERKNMLDEVELKLYRLNDRALAQKTADQKAALQALEIQAFKNKNKKEADKAQILGNPSASVQFYYAQKPYKDAALALAAQQPGQTTPTQNPSSPYYVPPRPVDPYRPSAADVNVMKALNSTTKKASFKGQAMKDVLEWIEEKCQTYKLTIIVDELGIKQALQKDEAAALFLNDPVTKEFKQPIKIRTLLRIILEERGMAYYIEDGIVYVTKDSKAATKLVVRTYPVANLVGGQDLVTAAINELKMARPNPMNPMAPPQPGQIGMLLGQNIDGLTNQIRGTVDPDHWGPPPAEAKGPGSMMFVPASASLQIRCSLEVHYLLQASGLLDNNPKR